MVNQGGQAQPTTLLLLLSSTQGLATEIESKLRNQGYPVRVAWASDLEDLEESVKRADPELLICRAGESEPQLTRVMSLLQSIAPDLPVVALADQRGISEVATAIAAGARDLVSMDDDAAFRHFEQVLRREFLSRQDLRKLRATRMRLAEFENRHRSLLSDSADAVAHISEGILIDANPAFASLLGQSNVADIIGQPFMDCIVAEDHVDVRPTFARLVKGKIGVADASFRLIGDGASVPVSAHLERREADGELFIDVLIHAPAQPNPPAVPAQPAGDTREEGRDAVRTAISSEPDHFGVLYLVIDGFEKLEERLGLVEAAQAAGILSQLARAQLPDASQLFRFAVSEWCALVPISNSGELEPIANGIRKELSAQLFKTDSFESHLSATIVAYPLGAPSDAADDIINNSAREARQHSLKGGNRVIAIGEAAREAAASQREQAVADSIRNALADQRLKLAYQSIASLDGDARQFYDVLVRMIDESGNEWLARDFLPVARKHGLMQSIDSFVLGRTLQMLDKRGPDKANTTFMVRIAEETLIDGDAYLEEASRLFKQHKVPEGCLIVQIQEAVLQNHVRKGKSFCEGLSKLGIAFAVDYFGGGQTSASLLNHFPARFVKFHPDFARNFDSEVSRKRLIELISAAQSRQAKIIIPYVEDTRVMAQLWQMGINYLQGNGLQEPEVVMLTAEAR
jgi:PAS domain S-box-containing protein